MTGPTDPIEDWLGADVELLPPRSGAFERVHRAARRRKTMRAAGTAAGAAAVIAAVAIAPQVAGTLLQHGTPPSKYTTKSPHPGPSRSPRHHSPPPHAARAAGPSLTSTTAGPPAARLEPTSVTFVGPNTGAVIGRVGGCPLPQCTAVAGTRDYGVTWHKVGAPPGGGSSGSSGVSQIRFGGLSNGWAYGPALYATHDGGATWRAISLPGSVTDLAAVGDRSFAVVASGGGFTLYVALQISDTWQPVPGAASATPEQPGGLQLTSSRGYVLAVGGLLAGPVTGGAWSQVPASAGTPACLRGTGTPGPAFLAPAPDGRVFLACGASTGPSRPAGPLTVYSSVSPALGWLRLGSVSTSGTPRSLTVAPSTDELILATTRGLSYSATGRTWQPAAVTGGVPRGGFSFVGMTVAAQGAAVPANPALGEIYTTTDGGLTWQRAPIRG